MHLAQLNIGRLRHATDDPRVAGFMDNLERINGLAERMPGFVWRLRSDSGHAMDIPVLADDPRMASNLTVWESVEALEHFVWNTVHRRFYERRSAWFEALDRMHFVMWWVAPGHRPSLAEALERLDHLEHHGDTDHAFGWAHLGGARLWRDHQCSTQAAE